MRSSETGTQGERAPLGRRFSATLVLLILGVEGTFFHLGGWNQYARLAAAVAFVEPGTPYTGVAPWYRSSRRLFLALAMSNIALYTLAISAMSAYQGGMTTSMRYLIIALPSFCVLLPDLRVFAYRKTLLVLFAVSAANAFVLAATSTMYLSEYPLSQHAYPDFLKGRLEFNPLLAAFGVNGTTAGFVVAAIYAFVLASLVRTLLAGARRGAERVRS